AKEEMPKGFILKLRHVKKLTVGILCVGTYGSVPNTLVIANCDVVKLKVVAAEHISQFNEEARSLFVKKFKTILHRGEGVFGI
ncbi:hypothetical protein Tco_1512733, partial [Tanacetum coccineum]